MAFWTNHADWVEANVSQEDLFHIYKLLTTDLLPISQDDSELTDSIRDAMDIIWRASNDATRQRIEEDK